MWVKAIHLRDFRNYKEATATFDPKVNVICGNNAQGKTNLLEALYLLITGRSFRTPHLTELIRFGADSFYLEALFEKNGIEQTLRFSFNGTMRSIIHNATALPSLSALLGILNGVILSPEDHSLVKGGPQARRHFLDLLIAQAHPLYLYHLSRFLNAMRQRNSLLKQRAFSTIDVWEEQMAPAAAFLTRHRAQTVAELERLSASEILSADTLRLSYRSQALAAAGAEAEALSTFFLKQFKKQRQRESDLGLTLSGPHRDDISILVHEKEARQFASEGQQRSCVASLKLAQWKWLNALVEQAPLLCIDDIGVSFDNSREEELYKRLDGLGQVFITSTRPSPLECRLIHVNSGIFTALQET